VHRFVHAGWGPLVDPQLSRSSFSLLFLSRDMDFKNYLNERSRLDALSYSSENLKVDTELNDGATVQGRCCSYCF